MRVCGEPFVMLMVPPLILLSLPFAPLPGGSAWWSWILRHSLATWCLGVGGMWLWHAPTLCNAAVTNGWIHRLQYVSLLLMGFASPELTAKALGLIVGFTVVNPAAIVS